MAKEITSANESKPNPINVVEQRNSLIRIMASQMARARSNSEMEWIYKAASESVRQLTGEGIDRSEAARALDEEYKRQGKVNARESGGRKRSVDGSSVGESVEYRANGVQRTSVITALKRGKTEGVSGSISVVFAKTSTGHVICRIVGERVWHNTRWSDEPNYTYKKNGRTMKNPF